MRNPVRSVVLSAVLVSAFAATQASGTAILSPPPGTGVVGGLIDAGSPAFFTGNGRTGFGNNSSEITFWIPGSANFTNNIRFDAVPFSNVEFGQEFLLGYLTYTNGSWYQGPHTMTLDIQTLGNSSSSPSYTQSGQFRLTLLVTANSANPNQSADTLFFEAISGGAVGSQMGSFRVFEGRSGTVELIGMFGSIDLVRFGSVTSLTGSGFVFPDCTNCTVPSGFTPLNTGLGTFAPPPPSAVPEPSSYLLAAGGLLGLLLKARRT